MQRAGLFSRPSTGVPPPLPRQGWLRLAGWLGACQCAWPAQGQGVNTHSPTDTSFLPVPGLAALTSGLRKSFPAAAPRAGHRLTHPATLCAAGKTKALGGEGGCLSHTVQAILAHSFHCSSAFSCMILVSESGHLNICTVLH